MASKIERAKLLATNAHSNHFRRDGKTPYINHPAQVVQTLLNWGITDEDIISAAWLHDTVEDTNLTCPDIEKEIGSVVADYVWNLTKVENKDYGKMEQDYIDKISNAPREVKLIKLADIMANLLDMHNIPNLDYKFEKYLGKKIKYLRAVSDNWNNTTQK